VTITAGFILVAILIAIAAGLFGSLLGLGGGLFVVPLLTGLLHVPIHNAIGASIVAVIATSSTGGSAYLRQRVANVRLGMTLEMGTVLGAILGALTTAAASPRLLDLVFGVVLLYTGYYMARGSRGDLVRAPTGAPTALDFSYHDAREKRDVPYRVRRLPVGLSVGFVAGYVSGILGVGGGLFKVPAMALLMGVPLKVATATSTFMIGVTGTAGAFIQYTHGLVDPTLTVPVVVGVIGGALLGPRVARRLPVARLRQIFVVVVIIFAAEMLWRAATGAA